MSREDQSFDELIRQKLDQRAFGFQEQSWQKAEELIKAGKVAGKTGGWGLGATVTAIVVATGFVAGTIFYVTKEDATANNAVVSSTAAPGTTTENAIALTGNDGADKNVSAAAKNEIGGENNNSVPAAASNANSTTPASSAAPANSSSTVNSSATASTGKTNPGTTGSKTNAKAGSSSTAQGNTKNNSGSSASGKSHTAGNTGKQNSKSSTSSSQSATPSTAGTQQASSQAGSSTSGNAKAAQAAQDQQPAATNELVSSPGSNPPSSPATENVTTSSPANSSAGNNTAKDPGESPSPEKSATNSTTVAANGPAATTTSQQQPAPASTENAQADSAKTIAASDSVQTAPPPPQPIPASGVNYWFVEGGVSFMPGFNAGNRSGRSLAPVLGGGYNFRVGIRFSMQAGLRYTFTGNASDSSSIYTSTTYGFGVTHHRTEIGLKRLHYVSVPVSVYWRINGKHSVFAGGSVNYLFASETRERTYTETNGSISDDRSRPVFGYGQGLNRFDAQVFGGYARTFGPHWSVECNLYFGLPDVKDDTWYGVAKVERNKGILLSLHYGF